MHMHHYASATEDLCTVVCNDSTAVAAVYGSKTAEKIYLPNRHTARNCDADAVSFCARIA